MRTPRSLRTKLTVLLVALLAGVTLTLGLLTHALMEKSLIRQTDDQLLLASERVTHYRGGISHADEADDAGSSSPSAGATAPTALPQTSPAPQGSPGSQKSVAPQKKNGDPLDAPGQGSGALTAVFEDSGASAGQILDPKTGNRIRISDSDRAILAKVSPSDGPRTVELSVGKYRVQSSVGTDPASGLRQVVVNGLPLNQVSSALTSLTWIAVGVGAGGLVLAGVVGTLLVRRELRPLERVSHVAQSVARLPLDAGEVRLAARVRPEDAREGTEAGAVGLALNELLDKVENALEARQASETKVRQFVADASHELRNPLAAIRGYSELLGATEHFSEDGLKSLGRVQAQSRRMGVLVEDLLLLARLDEGHAIQMGDVDLTRLVLETLNDFRVSAPEHRWALDLSDAPLSTRGDERQLHQVLANLLSNARKHTAAGTRITAGLHRSRDGRWAVLTVTDTGEGISPDFLPTIFERFTRADAARSGSDGTTGLGLSIVQAIVRSHGGTVGVESRPGHTVFTVRLPLAG